MKIETFFDSATSTFTYVVSDCKTKKCAVIDSVLDYDIFSGKVSTRSADLVIDYIYKHSLNVEWILETHIHADYLTASSYIKNKIGGKTAVGICFLKVLDMWVQRFNTENDTSIKGDQFDVLLKEGDQFFIGSLKVDVWQTPGHTPACLSYLIGDSIFVGDTIFAPHMGTARCDFPGGSAEDMYQSIQKFYSLPDNTKIYLCHDYPQQGYEALSMITVGEQKKHNIMIKEETSLSEYVEKRQERDKNLTTPKLLYPSIQVNMRGGKFGEQYSNGYQYIKTPIKQDVVF